jgi:hypothetical protein
VAVSKVDENGCTLGHHLFVRQDQGRDLQQGADPRHDLVVRLVYHLVRFAQQQERGLNRS